MKPVITLIVISATLFMLFGLAGTALWWNAWMFLAFMMPVGMFTQKLINMVASGPYGVIRHPGYAGSAVFNLLAPLALGSWPALIPGLAAALLLIRRTAREDRVLTEELPEYDLYAQQVRYRLVPGLW